MTSNNPKLPLLDAENPSAKLDEFSDRQQSIIDGLIELGLEYTNKISGKFITPENNTYFLLRDTIFFRLSAILFHLRLLLSVQKSHNEQFAKKPFDEVARMRLLDSGSQQQVFLLDSIIFHTISLFDYYGNLIDYICGSKKEMRLKWNGVLRSVRDPNNPLHNSPVVKVVVKLHNEFVDKLYKHRSDLIHYQTDQGGARTSVKLMTMESDFVVFAPKRLSRMFPDLRQYSDSHRLTINYVAFWISDRTLSAAHEIIGPLLKHIDLNRKTKVGSEIFIHRPIPENSSKII